jgi:hypothetical protein
MSRKLGGHQTRPVRFDDEKNNFVSPGLKPQTAQPENYSYQKYQRRLKVYDKQCP